MVVALVIICVQGAGGLPAVGATFGLGAHKQGCLRARPAPTSARPTRKPQQAAPLASEQLAGARLAHSDACKGGDSPQGAVSLAGTTPAGKSPAAVLAGVPTHRGGAARERVADGQGRSRPHRPPPVGWRQRQRSRDGVRAFWAKG